jgi:hypothetical protein
MLATKFEHVSMDVRGSGDYMPQVDAKIQRIKEQFRSNKGGLAWNTPPNLGKDLVDYVASRIYNIRYTAINQNVAPKVLFTGIHFFRRCFVWHLVTTVRYMMEPIIICK